MSQNVGLPLSVVLRRSSLIVVILAAIAIDVIVDVKGWFAGMARGIEIDPGYFDIACRRIDDAQRPEIHVLRVVIIAERECVPAVQPVGFAFAALVRFAKGQHDFTRKRISVP